MGRIPHWDAVYLGQTSMATSAGRQPGKGEQGGSELILWLSELVGESGQCVATGLQIERKTPLDQHHPCASLAARPRFALACFRPGQQGAIGIRWVDGSEDAYALPLLVKQAQAFQGGRQGV